METSDVYILISNLPSEGRRYIMLQRAKPLFKALKVLEASTHRTSSTSPDCTVPLHSERQPHKITFVLHIVVDNLLRSITFIIALLISLRHTSPIPIGQTQGSLLKVINLQAVRASNPIGYLVHNSLAILAIESHRSPDSLLK